jgi:hypothetical protein
MLTLTVLPRVVRTLRSPSLSSGATEESEGTLLAGLSEGNGSSQDNAVAVPPMDLPMDETSFDLAVATAALGPVNDPCWWDTSIASAERDALHTRALLCILEVGLTGTGFVVLLAAGRQQSIDSRLSLAFPGLACA